MDGRALGLSCLAAVTVAATAGGLLLASPDDPAPAEPASPDAQVPLKKASFDSEAPATAPAHWLPPEDWVYNHWLPYDEGRLYKLLRSSRGVIWRQLRDDRHNLAQLAARRGWPDPAKLADALVAPRAEDVSPATLATLRSRALRTTTQGHMAQHLFFHSLHQFAIPSEAPSIFGVTDAQFRSLRRGEQSPLEIGRLHGRSPARVQALSEAVLRERIAFGVRSGAMTEKQGAILLRRQISQLPRWLAQVRYNGPPTTHAGKLTSKPRDYGANPALSGDGRHVVFEAYRQKLPVALKQGEISVRSHPLRGGRELQVSFEHGRRTPRSAYNPAVSRDGRWVAYEASEGNLNFAKRYGQIHVFVHDAAGGRTRRIGRVPARAGVSRSEYNPVISGDGRRLAYQAAHRGGQSAIYVTDLTSGRAALASRGTRSGAGANAGVYDPAISGDGSKVAFTSAAANLGAGALGGRTQVWVRDLAARRTTLVSRADGARGAIAADYSSDPGISPDGRYVAFSSAATNLGGGRSAGRSASRVYVRDLVRRRTVAVSKPADGFALKPAISAGGRYVAYTAIVSGRSRVLMRDTRRGGPARLVSRAASATGAAADGPAADASISADGRLVTFSSAATNLSPAKSDDTRGVFVRDVRAHTTKLISAPSARTPPGGTKPQGGVQVSPADSQSRPTTAEAPRSAVVSIFDNAFFRGQDRPAVRLRAGGVLTWRWRSQQSHQVMALAGPQLPQSPAQTAGAYSVRLRKPGTYKFVCSIHAPGMRMTAKVH